MFCFTLSSTMANRTRTLSLLRDSIRPPEGEGRGSFPFRKGLRLKGFTLIEMIVALAATGLILGAAYTTLFSGLDSYRYSAYRGETFSILQRALDRIFDDLSSAHLSASGGRFVIENDSIETEEYGEIPLDRLRFQSLVSKISWDDRPQEDLAEIEYFVDNDPETPPRWLVRRIQSPVDSDLSSGGVIHLAGPRVLGIDIRAFDGAQWVEEWDSSDRYPKQILVKLYMAPPASSRITDRVLTLSSSTWIPGSNGQASTPTSQEGAPTEGGSP